MKNSPVPLPESEFNDFLFAPIGEDRNGMLVSVLSGLARSGVDPWQEAAKLAQLPGDSAAERLAALIGALPDKATPYPDSRTIATRLIALLPHPPRFNGGARNSHSAWAATNSRRLWIYVVAISFVLGSLLTIASYQQSAKPDDGGKVVGTASPPGPPMNLDNH